MRKIWIAIIGMTLGIAAGYAADHAVTAGWFVKRLAEARKLDASSPEAARAALERAGVRLPALELSQTLREGDVVKIGTALGLRLTTRQPDAPFSEQQASTFFSAIGPAAQQAPATPDDVGGTPNPNSENGKGKKKGHDKSTSEPTGLSPQE